MKTALDKLNSAINRIVTEYADMVNVNVDEVAQKIGTAGANALRAKSREMFGNGDYAKGWRKQVDVTRTGVTVTLYNATEPSLVHLLEHGHVTRNGTGRTFKPTPAHVHVAPIEQELAATFEQEVKARL